MKYRQHNLKPISDGAVEVLCNEIRSLKIDIELTLKKTEMKLQFNELNDLST